MIIDNKVYLNKQLSQYIWKGCKKEKTESGPNYSKYYSECLRSTIAIENINGAFLRSTSKGDKVLINIDLSRTQQYLDWMKEKLFLNHCASTTSRRKVSRGQVYRCNLGVGIGSEECKERPCVILQYNSANTTSPNTIVAPITHTTSTLKTVIPINDKIDSSGAVILDGNVLLGNIVCVSKARLGDYVVDLSTNEMQKVDEAISVSLGINHYFQTLKNKYDDKLVYIEKLQTRRDELTEDCIKNENIIEEINNLMSKYKIATIEEMESILKKSAE